MGMCMVCFTRGLSEGVEYSVPWHVHFRIQMIVQLHVLWSCINNGCVQITIVQTVNGVIPDFFFFDASVVEGEGEGCVGGSAAWNTAFAYHVPRSQMLDDDWTQSP